jgi:ATP-dependent RNA helicase SUPV3L1/SUV3
VRAKLAQIPPPPTPGITSYEIDENMPPDGFLTAAGFRVVGPRAIRLDMLDRLEEELEATAASGQTADAAQPKLLSLLGCDRETLEDVLEQLGWARVEVKGGETPVTVWRHTPQTARHPRRKRRHREESRKVSPDSPFAGLASLFAAD